jgi:hypothetical protein
VLLWRTMAIVQVFCRRQFGLDPDLSVCCGLIAIGLVGYVALFTYVCSTTVGLSFSALFFGMVLGQAYWHLRYGLKAQLSANEGLLPFAIAALFGVIYLAFFYLYSNEIIDNRPDAFFFEKARPHDYRIPLIFAESIYHRLPNRTGADQFGWYFSDRPPLQTGLVLLLSPLWKVIRPDLVYQAIGTLLQSSSIAAAWLLCRNLGFVRREIVLVVLALGGSGFLYYNSIYVWPKLLAATFFLVTLTPLGRSLREQRRMTGPECAIFGASATLAFLAHGGVGFSLLALVLMLAASVSRFFSIRTLGLSIAIAGVLYAPWALYTHFVDPNNAKLLKTHFTSGDSDSTEPFLTMLIRSYRQITLGEWLMARYENLRALDDTPAVSNTEAQLVGGLWNPQQRTPLEDRDYPAIFPGRLSYDLTSLGTVLRIDQREHVFRALGPLCLAGPLLILLCWRRCCC